MTASKLDIVVEVILWILGLGALAGAITLLVIVMTSGL